MKNGYNGHIIDTTLRYLEKSNIDKQNKKTIKEFTTSLSAEGLTQDRQSKYIYALVQISKRINNKLFSKVTKSDIEKLIGQINNEDISEWTKRDYRIITKRLIKYIRLKEGQKYSEKEYPEEVNWLSSSIKKKDKRKYSKDILKPEDIKLLASGTLNLRDKAFILFLYESGARIGEVMNMRIKDFKPEEAWASASLFGKTGERTITIISSAPAINNWIKHHPTKDNIESYLFCSINRSTKGKQNGYWYFNKLLREAKKRVGLDKPVNPHHFRHSRASDLAKKFTEAHLCNYMGWEFGSKEAADYVHTSRDETNNAYKVLHGLAIEELEKETFKPIDCPRCSIKNDPSAKRCMGCGMFLNDKSINEYLKQKEEATKMGLGFMESGQNTQDAINQALLDEIKALRTKVEAIEKQKI